MESPLQKPMQNKQYIVPTILRVAIFILFFYLRHKPTDAENYLAPGLSGIDSLWVAGPGLQWPTSFYVIEKDVKHLFMHCLTADFCQMKRRTLDILDSYKSFYSYRFRDFGQLDFGQLEVFENTPNWIGCIFDAWLSMSNQRRKFSWPTTVRHRCHLGDFQRATVPLLDRLIQCNIFYFKTRMNNTDIYTKHDT